MDRSRMIHKDDEIKRRFIQVDQLLLENPKYEKLSDGAILTYAIMRDRLDLSKKNSDVFSDENGYLFLTYTDEELAMITHRSRRTMSDRKKELVKFGLLYSVRMGQKQANRLYILEPETCDPATYLSVSYHAEKDAEREKKAMEDIVKKMEINEKNVMRNICTSLETVGMRNICASDGCADSALHDAQNLRTIYTDLNHTEQEEEELIYTRAREYLPNYLREILGPKDFYGDTMLKRIMNEMEIIGLSFITKEEAVNQHRLMLKKSRAGEVIFNWAKYFVGGIELNRLSEDMTKQLERNELKKQFLKYTQEIEEEKPAEPVPFYNWLEKKE